MPKGPVSGGKVGAAAMPLPLVVVPVDGVVVIPVVGVVAIPPPLVVLVPPPDEAVLPPPPPPPLDVPPLDDGGEDVVCAWVVTESGEESAEVFPAASYAEMV